MCVIVAKYFPTIGWVAVKNRDRNYIPEISFKKKIKNGIEITYFWDDITQYCEGINSGGVSILSASLMVLDDEKEITSRAKKPSVDGGKIQHALKFANPKAAAMDLIKQKLPGNTVIFDSQTMILLEGAWSNFGKKEYEYRVSVIPHTDTVARTNHGIWIPAAGYQRTLTNDAESASRISSESRLAIAQYVADTAKTPEELIDNLCKTYVDNPQLNAFRTTADRKKMRTTAQLMLIPSQLTMYVRPVQSNVVFDFWKLNHPSHQTWVEILSNRALYTHASRQDLDSMLSHTIDN